MNASEELSPGDALQEIDRMRRHVGRSTRWTGWLFLIWGFSAVTYWSAMFFVPAWRAFAGVAWLIMTILSTVYVYRQGVYGHGYTRLQGTVTIAWVITMAGAALTGMYVLPGDPSGWWIALGVTVAVVAALPVLYAGWRLRPWEGAR
ncbi:hypothetical protein GCM10022226_52810 [Sphaerisporangium flaviroseum]|uniref:Uncharacterized protein n=1 Tax=Sphaerisporangium flaviroseum TaxID=509199 RepID=A0ABP7ISZ5_9ACTN